MHPNLWLCIDCVVDTVNVTSFYTCNLWSKVLPFGLDLLAYPDVRNFPLITLSLIFSDSPLEESSHVSMSSSGRKIKTFYCFTCYTHARTRTHTLTCSVGYVFFWIDQGSAGLGVIQLNPVTVTVEILSFIKHHMCELIKVQTFSPYDHFSINQTLSLQFNWNRLVIWSQKWMLLYHIFMFLIQSNDEVSAHL